MTFPVPAVPDDVRSAADAVLTEHVEVLPTEIAPLGPDIAALVTALRHALAGGKRLRAAFCYWSWRAHAERGPGLPVPDDHRRAVRVGASLELFHAAALVHDDVMDASDTRRGRPAAHREFETVHRTAAWTGDAGRFGQAGAILLGDLALVASERELSTAVAGLAFERRAAVRAIFDLMRTEVTAGQYLDVLAQVVPWGIDHELDEERTLTVVRAKSARYSVEHPLALGAALAGASEQDLSLLHEVGLALGEAFQLRDDLLGVFGDPAATGKPAGDDLREGKRTLLVVRALRAAPPSDAAMIREAVGRPGLTEEDVARVRAALRRCGAVDQVEARIAELAEPALAALAGADLAEPGRSALAALGRAAVHRSA
ncbi:MAG TPA: polyprenyl synthetase family protein [Actinotalea sp.]|nr:polyprenyl synthetase family protein [Actinotalea sp.]